MNLVSAPKQHDKIIALLTQELGTSQKSNSYQELLSPLLTAPYYMELPNAIKAQAQDLAFRLFQIYQKLPVPVAIKVGQGLEKSLTLPLPTVHSGFSGSIDVHWCPDIQKIKVIELNTNAAFLALSRLMDLAALGESQVTPQLIADWALESWGLPLDQSKLSPPRVAIVDEQAQEQRLYIEFLLYQNWFKNAGWDCDILDVDSSLEKYTHVYNRSTDFYFENIKSQKLLAFWLGGPNQVTPNPLNYHLFADKTNLTHWQQHSDIRSYLALTQQLTPENSTELWGNRKALFFKPNKSFGSKMTYRGESISRKNFELLASSQNAMAQEYFPPPELESAHHGPLKYDLRFYVQNGQVTQSVARLYQGQVTNARTPGGGFASIKWV